MFDHLLSMPTSSFTPFQLTGIWPFLTDDKLAFSQWTFFPRVTAAFNSDDIRDRLPVDREVVAVPADFAAFASEAFPVGTLFHKGALVKESLVPRT